jgi:type I restriction enzyme S subunit
MVSSVPLRDLCEAIVDCPHSTPTWTTSGAVVLRNQNIRNGRLDLSEPSYTDEQHFEQRTKRAAPRAGDLVITREAPMGEVCMIPPGLRCCLGQRMVLLRADSAVVDPRYLLYALQSRTVQNEIGAREGTGSTVSNLRIPLLEMLPIPYRPIQEQHGIADVLGAFDDKIALNKRMNATLDAMAGALFKSWFVDFEPVRAKIDGRHRSLPTSVSDLFPDAFESSDRGRVPRGWRYRPLSDLVDLTRGTTYKSSMKDLPGPVLLGLASIQRNGGFRDDKLSTYGGDSPAKLLLAPGDLFVSLKDVTQSADLLGAVARVPSHVFQGRLTQDTVKLSFKSQSTSHSLVYHTLLTSEYRDYCRSHATGTTNLGLSRNDFFSYPVIQPNEAVQRWFDAVVQHLEDRMSSAKDESRTLTAIRDALLPKLVSGELRLSDAEHFAVEAGV